ncbi:NAD(P)-dependent dehydrogenase (short-subunit alcohol dehydrogenase family) [Leeuwenhoekiella aestuarii]|uniref:NAD(P)-dependent dehydrogenase (Short-subunit alcohol dehydrogenase family) n=1 Tax=Leeuwenhoekiella aestuarii TaxID=2249426 RepID=A0A4V1KNP7_9FLAO|nr:SDR family NAD(P)-dependent oxidoreductase [Leeuwenhoekiella aestuarii]RXG11423.1 NAD(P)-dependent dehydrogenase (short-subunit alcohol dehydrogenase family) [Leeuwenhoekiella aestuarii]RXG12160.1 NAD(P)-dependent dehydrogenase (short-subunit alcohol dehydrogenase family) [Leeuwenhoekiella aestuarii]
MKKVFITGATDGLGFMAAEKLIEKGHQVILHARNNAKGEIVLQKLPNAKAVVIGDLSSISQTYEIAEAVNQLGTMDSVIHNAGVGFQEPYQETEDALPYVFAINSLAPYILTCLINKPKRLIYTSSGMHQQGDAELKDLFWKVKKWNAAQAYSDTKLQNILLAFAISKRWPDVFCNVVSPGWVATKMGGPHAPDDLEKATETQVWLSSSEEKEAKISGNFLYHKRPKSYLLAANDIQLQNRFMDYCESLTNIKLPNG